MTSLYLRADAQQKRLLKIISGAVIDAANGHPGAKPDRKFARSVAKRAVGTISAYEPRLLASDACDPPSYGRRTT
jgi:hypothetical protein